MSTERKPVAYSVVYLGGRVQAMLATTFLVLDYWPEEATPLLFETKLSNMHTNKSFDAYRRRYSTYLEAKVGHEAASNRLRSKSARVL